MANVLHSSTFRRLVTIAALSLIVLVAVAWTVYSARPVDRSLLTGDPCSAPCWYGIIPSQTSTSEAMILPENSPYVRQGTLVQNGTDEAGGVTWYWRVSGYQMQPRMTWLAGTVREIAFGIPIHVTMGQIIEKFGPPEAISMAPGGVPEDRFWIVDLFHSKLGLQFKAYVAESAPTISETTRVGAAIYYAPTNLRTRLVAYYGIDSTNQGLELVREWEGYGDLFGKYYDSPGALLIDE